MKADALDNAIRSSLQAQAERDAAATADSVDRIWQRIEVGGAARARTLPRVRLRRRAWHAATAAVACLVVLIGVGGPRWMASRSYYPPGVPLATAADNAQVAQVAARPQMSLPAPMPTVPGFAVRADPVPACVGQTVTIASADRWAGSRIWLYLAPESDQYLVAYLHRLPSDAVLVGAVDVSAQDGSWSTSWQIPNRLEHDGFVYDLSRMPIGCLVAVNDQGHLAYQGLQLGPKRTIAVTPQPAGPGDAITITGSDYPPSATIRIDILHDSIGGGTDLQTNLGWATADPTGAFTFSYTLPARWNWPYADRTGTVQDHWLTVGSPGTYHILTVEQIGDGRAATEKLVEIGK